MYRYVVEVLCKSNDPYGDPPQGEYSGIYHTSQRKAADEVKEAMSQPDIEMAWICQKRVENWEVNR